MSEKAAATSRETALKTESKRQRRRIAPIVGSVAMALLVGAGFGFNASGNDQSRSTAQSTKPKIEQQVIKNIPPDPTAGMGDMKEIEDYIAVKKYLDLAAFVQDYWVDFWTRVHSCEQPEGEWHVYGYNGGLRVGGGLGIMLQAWLENREVANVSAPTPQSAAPLDQMGVATVIYGRFGDSAWGCLGGY